MDLSEAIRGICGNVKFQSLGKMQLESDVERITGCEVEIVAGGLLLAFQ